MDHATDMIVQVDAPSVKEAFVQAGIAVVDTTIDVSNVKVIESSKVDASGSDMRHLLYSWLEEIIYKMITDGFAISRLEITELNRDDYTIKGIVYGEPIDLKRHGFKVEIKAPTFYDMRIDESQNGTSMQFLLDL
ncbi:MAG: hypothetical protein K8823_333 [Cenarchaeum symbiont of Oopsacas minuta]|nr:hypothetical protein [Cenarchaeum symbiont of Oopsacas minuta]